jgi:hypothetical protein
MSRPTYEVSAPRETTRLGSERIRSASSTRSKAPTNAQAGVTVA